MIIPEEGKMLKYRLNGNTFEVKKITNHFVILHSVDGSTQILTGEKSLVNSFEEIQQINPPGVGMRGQKRNFPNRPETKSG
jgi:hypothetical protein